jgi:hypothetical protein
LDKGSIRNRALIFTLSLACLATLAAAVPQTATATTVRDRQIAFARAYVTALHSKDRPRILAFFHPSVRACIDGRTKPFFDSIVDQQLQGLPSGTFTSAAITHVNPKTTPTLWAFLPAKSFPYPIMPTDRIQIDFTGAPGGYLTDILEVAPSGSSWYLVTACPNDEGMRIVRQVQAEGARQKAKAKKLAAALHGPLLAKIKHLLAAHDRMGAAEAYSNATGVDFATAGAVIDVLENP